ncbi:hypothetical protein HYQ46_005445 [Verticillium longisporum]|nr:hypothetical protein HYQ46_005445 [Verticillium longisporum]
MAGVDGGLVRLDFVATGRARWQLRCALVNSPSGRQCVVVRVVWWNAKRSSGQSLRQQATKARLCVRKSRV